MLSSMSSTSTSSTRPGFLHPAPPSVSVYAASDRGFMAASQRAREALLDPVLKLLAGAGLRASHITAASLLLGLIGAGVLATVYAWLAVELFVLPGTLPLLHWGFALLLAVKVFTGFVQLRHALKARDLWEKAGLGQQGSARD